MMGHPLSPRSGVALLDKGILLLTIIIGDGGNKTLSVLAEDAGIAASTARRIAGALERQGLLMRSEQGRFVAGRTLHDLAFGSDLRVIRATAARYPLRRLAVELTTAAHLGIFEADMVTYLVRENAAPLPLFTREGGQLEAYCSGIGKVLLAFAEEDVRERYLNTGGFVALTGQTITEPGRLRAELENVRSHGYAIDDGEIADDLRCLAVPVFELDRVVAAISVSAAPGRLRKEHDEAVINKLGRCAKLIELRMNPLQRLAREAELSIPEPRQPTYKAAPEQDTASLDTAVSP